MNWLGAGEVLSTHWSCSSLPKPMLTPSSIKPTTPEVIFTEPSRSQGWGPAREAEGCPAPVHLAVIAPTEQVYPAPAGPRCDGASSPGQIVLVWP